MSGSVSRIRSLDGVRGVAAFVVVLHHCSLIARSATGDETWAWITQSPLKLMIAGSEAVLVFFVLSGLVVALPALRDGFSWAAYFPTRALRLYLPVFGSLILAAILVVAVPRHPQWLPDGAWLADAQADKVEIAPLLSQATLLRATYDFNNVLWSLRWELFFSLLLPIFVGLAVLLRKQPVLLVLGAIAASTAGNLLGIAALVYLPVFLIGTVMAVHLDRIVAWSQRPRSPWVWPFVASVGGVLLIGAWLARPFAPADTWGAAIFSGLSAAGAGIAVLVAIVWPAARRFCERRVSQWLGKISFSLYLVHVPLLATLGYLFGPERWWLVAAVGIPLSLAVAVAFHRFVERPSHLLARAAGRFVGERVPAMLSRA